MPETLNTRFATATDQRAYPAPIVCHPGGYLCRCGSDSVIWYAENGSKTELCAVCYQKLIASLEKTADELVIEAEQERALAARLRATYAYAVALGIT